MKSLKCIINLKASKYEGRNKGTKQAEDKQHMSEDEPVMGEGVCRSNTSFRNPVQNTKEISKTLWFFFSTKTENQLLQIR